MHSLRLFRLGFIPSLGSLHLSSFRRTFRPKSSSPATKATFRRPVPINVSMCHVQLGRTDEEKHHRGHTLLGFQPVVGCFVLILQWAGCRGSQDPGGDEEMNHGFHAIIFRQRSSIKILWKTCAGQEPMRVIEIASWFHARIRFSPTPATCALPLAREPLVLPSWPSERHP